jgi:hypothetical protein
VGPYSTHVSGAGLARLEEFHMPTKRVARPRKQRVWRCGRYKIIEVNDGFELFGSDYHPEVFSDRSDKSGLWIKVGDSMRRIHIWRNPMAKLFGTEDPTVGKVFEDITMQ